MGSPCFQCPRRITPRGVESVGAWLTFAICLYYNLSFRGQYEKILMGPILDSLVTDFYTKNSMALIEEMESFRAEVKTKYHAHFSGVGGLSGDEDMVDVYYALEYVELRTHGHPKGGGVDAVDVGGVWGGRTQFLVEVGIRYVKWR